MYYIVLLDTACQAARTAANPQDSSTLPYLSLLTASGIQHRKASRAVKCFFFVTRIFISVLQRLKCSHFPSLTFFITSIFGSSQNPHSNINFLLAPQHRHGAEAPPQTCPTHTTHLYLGLSHTTTASCTEENLSPGFSPPQHFRHWT